VLSYVIVVFLLSNETPYVVQSASQRTVLYVVGYSVPQYRTVQTVGLPCTLP